MDIYVIQCVNLQTINLAKKCAILNQLYMYKILLKRSSNSKKKVVVYGKHYQRTSANISAVPMKKNFYFLTRGVYFLPQPKKLDKQNITMVCSVCPSIRNYLREL